MECDAGIRDEDHGFGEGEEVDVEEAAEVVLLAHFGEHWLWVYVWWVALHGLADDFEVTEEHGVRWGGQVFVESSMIDKFHDEEDEVDASGADAHPHPILGQIRCRYHLSISINSGQWSYYLLCSSLLWPESISNV